MTIHPSVQSTSSLNWLIQKLFSNLNGPLPINPRKMALTSPRHCLEFCKDLFQSKVQLSKSIQTYILTNTCIKAAHLVLDIIDCKFSFLMGLLFYCSPILPGKYSKNYKVMGLKSIYCFFRVNDENNAKNICMYMILFSP